MKIKICKCCGKPKKPKEIDRRFSEIVGGCAAICTSPPYVDSMERSGGIDPLKSKHTGGPNSQMNNSDTRYGSSKGQIGTLKSGDLDSIITSPPFEDINVCQDPKYQTGRTSGGGPLYGDYGNSEGQIGKMKGGDLNGIVTSPPYEESLGHNRGKAGAEREASGKYKQGYTTGEITKEYYSHNPDNIGNEKSKSYWEAMYKVYSECHKALKSGGYLVVVVKAYVKNKRRVPLPQQTLKLLIHLGFEPIERIKAMLTEETIQGNLFGSDIVKTKSRKSFFRRLAENRGSPKIDWEEVLIVRKISQYQESNLKQNN